MVGGGRLGCVSIVGIGTVAEKFDIKREKIETKMLYE